MHLRRVLALCTTVLFFLTVAVRVPAWSDERSNVKVTGLVVSIVSRGGSFELREFRTDSRWLIILHREVEVEGDDDDKKGRPLTVGDVVEVKGQVLDGRTILATKIKVLGHATGQIPVGPGAPPAAPANPSSNTLLAIIKTLGIGYAVRTFSPQINNFINDLLQNKGAAVRAQTKVVPILSISIGISNPGGAYIGAAQVSGPAAAVNNVQAVALVETDFQTTFRIKVYVPVDSLEPWKALRRVPGVGVSAIIDLRI